MYSAYEPKTRIWHYLICLGMIVFFIAAGIGVLLAVNYKHLGNLVKVVSLIRSQYLVQVDTTTLVDGAIQGIVKSLDDPYSVYLDPKTFAQLKEQIRGAFGGLGILLNSKDGYLTVVRSYPGTPAQKAGISEGDKIIKIDNRDVKGIDLETAVELMRGPIGTRVKLTITREGFPPLREVELTREEISVPTVEGHMLKGTEIGYIALTQFTEKTPEEVEKIISSLKKQGMRGILLDLRDNPGGELHSAVKVAGNFIPRGPVVYINYRSGRNVPYFSDGHSLGLPLVVLINEASASAAEILAGAIKDTRAGILVGKRTFGKAVVQEIFQLDNGAGLKLTTARYLTPAKNDINKKGITPDITVAQENPSEEDLQMKKAVEILVQKLARAA